MAEHDQFFKRTFRVPEHAAGELRSVLPSEVVAAIDFDSLELLQSDLVSKRLDERFSDALFRAKFDGVEGYLWLLLEHQSEPDHFMVLRLLEYLVRSWLELLRREPTRRTLPPIVCVVVHHGEKGWTAPTRLHDLVEGLDRCPALAQLVPNFEIIVDDLVAQGDEQLKSRPLGVLPRVALWALRDARVIQRFYEHLSAWAAELARLAVESPEDAGSVMRYILSVGGDDSFEQVQQRVIQTAPAAEASMATFAEQLRAEGRVQGRAEGMAQAVLAVLSVRGLIVGNPERARIVASKDLAELEGWLRLAAKVSSVEQLFVVSD